MSSVIRIMGFANGYPCPHAGEYVETMDFEARDGRGYLTTTPDIAKALKFTTPNKAYMFWKTRSRTCPTRPDGKPNRPLTMLHASIEPADNPTPG